MKPLHTLSTFSFKKVLHHIFDVDTEGKTEHGDINILPKHIAVADIGNSKIVVLIASMNKKGEIEVIGMGEEKSEGVVKGVVSNILKTSQCLKKALDKATEQAGFIPDSIIAGISCTINVHKHHSILTRKDSFLEITANDISELETEIHQSLLYSDEKVIYTTAQHFSVDSEHGIIDPKGMTGTKLETTFKLITCQLTYFKNLERCCNLLNITLKAVYPSIIASAKSILHDDEIAEGVALVDIGAGNANLAVFKNGILLHAESIPFGGNNITKDIAEFTGLPFNKAEKIKLQYAEAIHTNINSKDIIEIEVLKQRKRVVYKKDIAFVAQCRLEEILDLIDYSIMKHIQKENIVFGLVFIGGVSKTHLFKRLAKLIINTDCVVFPKTKLIFTSVKPEIKAQLNNPVYSTALGLLKLEIRGQ
ncbi:cell division protein FtsA [Pelobium manganitolerans]|uniref:cell division protein FtsA n=1 Tax=Pelobium manganitolerans TaxID=1842495 RepID=UPI003FA3CD03